MRSTNPRIAKKGQVIEDFLVKIQSFDPSKKELMVLPKEEMRWNINSDGASNKEGARVGVVLNSSSRVIIEEVF